MLLVALPLGLCGCAPCSTLRLEQPRGPVAQQRLDLSSQQVYWTESEGVYRVLAEAPLPGAQTGRPTYVLYLRVTMGSPETGKGAAGKGGVRPVDARGFLIQTRGPLRGLTMVTEVAVEAVVPTAGKTVWRLSIDLKCEDGTVVVGDLFAQRENWRVMRFETRTNAADVQALLQSPAPMIKHGRVD